MKVKVRTEKARKAKEAERRQKETAISDTYRRYATAVRDWRAVFANKRDAQIIEKYKALDSMLAAAAETFKAAARSIATYGETQKIILEDDDVLSEVSVVQPETAKKYDEEIARKHWPPSVLKKVLVVDSTRVLRAIAEGDLSSEVAQEAELEVAPCTARVSIRLLDAPPKKGPRRA